MASNTGASASLPENPGSAADETQQRIVQAAAMVFAEKGYARATTRALAAAAGVNEVTLFRHFGSKQNLFAAVIERFAAPAVTAAIEAELTGDYRQDLLVMGHLLMEIMTQRKEAVRLMLCEADHFPEVRDIMVRNPRELRQQLAGYLQRQIDLGRVRQLHAEATAQAFWGMFFAYGISVGILAEPVQPPLSDEKMVSHFVDIFVRGTISRGPQMEADAEPPQ
jgi:AcrR family transcriptional regulator